MNKHIKVKPGNIATRICRVNGKGKDRQYSTEVVSMPRFLFRQHAGEGEFTFRGDKVTIV